MKAKGKISIATAVVMGLGVIGAGTFGLSSQRSMAAVTSVTVANPAMSTVDPTQWAGQILIDQGTIFEGLYGYNKNNQLEPKIASRYVVSNGGRVWTIYLRHNAKWSNGQPVTAEDFYYSWMRLLSPADSTGALWASVAQYAVNAAAYHLGQVPATKVGIQVVNPFELRLTLTAPHDILGELALTSSMPLYPPIVKAHPTNWFMPEFFVGDGPYVISSFVPNGDITLTRNAHYVGNGSEVNVGNVDQINLIPAPTVPVEDYLANKMDLAFITNPSDYKYILNNPTLKSQLHLQPADEVYYLEWDKSISASPLDNVLVRQAIAMAINRAPLAQDVLSGLGGAANGFGAMSWSPVKYEHGLPFNVTKARLLLAKAGYPGGKGIPTLQLYCQVQSLNPSSISVAEALAQEFKQELNINFQIDPLASTVYGGVTWGGLIQGIKPGFNIGNGVVNWIDPGNDTIQANDNVLDPGTIGPTAYRQHISEWYFPKFSPDSVARYGNPDDTSMGLTWHQWLPLQKAVLSDNRYLTSWMKRQPAWYQSLNQPLPGATTLDLWNGIVNQWKSAKTDMVKNAAWVEAWKLVGNYTTGTGGANVGLDGQVYEDKHQPEFAYQMTLDNARLDESVTSQQADLRTARIVNALMQSGYDEPLYYAYNAFLQKPDVHGGQTNPFSWQNFYQLQYLTVSG